MDQFIYRTEQYIRERSLLESGDHLIVGVSGGPDSICLLEVLDALRGKWDWKLTVVHVHHGIRGNEADEDEAFVRMICRAKGIPCHLHRISVPELARQQGLGEEEAGRIARREIFERELADALKGEGQAAGRDSGDDGAVRGRIVLAHHADDNAETLILNLCRGTGLYGLGGMSPESGVYVRPLLWAERARIEEFVLHYHLAFRQDQTNGDDAYTRNRIRMHVLPYLKEFVNSRTGEHMNQTMEELRGLAEYLTRETDRLYGRYVTGNPLEIAGDAAGEDPYILSLLVRRCLIETAGRAKDIERAHISAVTGLFASGTGSRLDLPYGMRAERTYEGVKLTRGGPRTSAEAGPEGAAGYEARSRFVSRDEVVLRSDDPYTKYFDYGIIGEQSVFRTRQPGDYIVIDSAGHRQKVGDWFTDHRIPRDERDRIPLLADGHHVYWIAGYRQAQDCLITESTDSIIEWRIKLHES